MTTLSAHRVIQSARDTVFCAAHNLTCADSFARQSPRRAVNYLRDAEACLEAALEKVRDTRRACGAFPQMSAR